LTTVEITSKALAVAVAIILARRGAGYWTLAVMQLVDGGARAAGVWIACGWRPGPPKRRVGLRAMIVLGGNLTGSRILDYLTRNLDNVLIGWRWGARETGLYTRAYKILLLPINQINVPLSSVALPALTRLKNDPDRFNNYYLNVLWVIAFITMPLVALMFVLSKEIIDLVLGPQWGGVVLIFRFLCLSALFEPILSVLNWLYMSTGRTDRMFKWGMVTTIIMVISFFIGLPYGARGVALAYSLTTLILVVPSIAYATSHTRMDIKDIIVTIRPALLATLVAGTAGLAFKHLLNLEISIWIETIISGLMMMAVYLIITLGFYGKRDFLIDFFKEVFHQGQSAST
jgi:PST family polysaccharide transporter